ncbi:uncharacterized protein RJT21DRAFT_123264 [Scheffersomyces amazonensis]|uniref:uncharacterized protein n=1 Tax=Scheffersomyces amazonensis TaxID=1078765 RepID=UPI00315D913E
MTDQPTVAPYGGFIVKTLDEEKERELKLQQQSTIEVNINGNTETLRPEALHIRGVDSLSSEDIKSFVDYYVNYLVTKDEETGKETYEQLPIDEQITFRIQWVNDSDINIAFKTHEDSFKALKKLSITASNPAIYEEDKPQELTVENVDYLTEIIQERETKPYNAVLNFIKHRDLSARLGLTNQPSEPNGDEPQQESETMEEDHSSVVLHIRQSFQSDRKVKNAKLYSRYYLLHGEPERQQHRRNNYRDRERRPRRDRDQDNRSQEQQDEDLFAEKLANPNVAIFNRRSNDDISEDAIIPDDKPSQVEQEEEEEEDLFAYKLRERSPSRRY